MNKYKTCLAPFMFHLLSLLAKGTLTEYTNGEYDILKGRDVSSVSMLEQRKKIILDETIKVLSCRPEEQKAFFAGKKGSRSCGLCISCIGCEEEYWQEVRRLLGNDNKPSEYNLPKEIDELLVQKEKPEEIYVKNYLLTRQTHEYLNKLVMLKGFSSSTPFLLNHSLNTNYYSGGGFYFNWYGVGIAIDPGYHFVQNLHQNGLNVLDINVVVITHEHIDHNSDMRLLDDLHYNASKVFRDDRWLWDESGWGISQVKDPRHTIHWYMDDVTYEMADLLRKKGSGFSSECNELHCVKIKPDGKAVFKLSERIRLDVFRTKHEQIKDKKDVFWPHTFGCAFTCMQKDGTIRKIGYTSDTSFHTDIVSNMCEVLKDCDILIENISGIYKEDILLETLKERHLGYYGCYKLIEELHARSKNKLRYVLLSEFSNLVNDIRFDIAKYMQDNIHQNIDSYIQVYPAEIGMVVDLDYLSVRCSECYEYTGQPMVVRQEDENMPLRYCCGNCAYRTEAVREIGNEQK